MRVLILVNSDLVVYNFKKELLKAIIDLGNEVYIVVPTGNKNDLLKDIGCEIINFDLDRRGINPIKDLRLIAYYNKIIKKIKPDKVLTYTIKPNIYGGIACRINKVNYYTNITGLGSAFQSKNIIHTIVTFLYKVSLKKVDTVFFENVANKNVFIKEKIIKDNKAVILNGAGVNLQEFTFKPLPNKGIISFLFIGRIMKEKGINELFAVSERIKKEYKDVEFNFIGGFEEDYKDKIETLEQKGIIKYYGMQKDVKSFIEKAHCVVLPSYHEGMSNALLESAAMGRPLIASNINGCKEAIIENKSGFLCEAKNKDSLYECVKRFIELTFEEKVSMGELSRKHMEVNFDKKEVVEKTVRRIYA